LNLLEQIDKSIHASGAIAVDTVVRGEVTRPLLNGSIELKSASINVEPIPNSLTNANGTIALRREGQHHKSDSGHGRRQADADRVRGEERIEHPVHAAGECGACTDAVSGRERGR
jgi:hypothetical protein